MPCASHCSLVILRIFTKSRGFEVLNLKKYAKESKDFDPRSIVKLKYCFHIPQTATRALRQLCRHRAELLNDVSSYKNRLTALLDQTFPGYDKVFSDVGGVTSCAVLVRFPTPTILLVEEESELVEVIAAASKAGYSFAKKKAGLLISAAQKAQTLGIHSCADETLIVCTIQMLRTLSESVLQIETAIDNLLAQIKEMRNNVSLLQSIPGVGSHSAALLLGEIGDISLFKKPKQLAAYFGL